MTVEDKKERNAFWQLVDKVMEECSDDTAEQIIHFISDSLEEPETLNKIALRRIMQVLTVHEMGAEEASLYMTEKREQIKKAVSYALDNGALWDIKRGFISLEGGHSALLLLWFSDEEMADEFTNMLEVKSNDDATD
jgi:hypothetical protein